MSKSKSIDQKLADLKARCRESKSAEAAAALRAGLADRSNYVVKKAAQIIEEAKLEELIPELVAAFERMTVEPEKTDVGCLGKTALMQALVNLGHNDVEFFRRAIKYRQPEGVWGGETDPAAHVRAGAAAGLAGSARVLVALMEFADLLVDRDKPARIGAAKALAQLNCPDGIPLLRLKILTGDKDPEVLGECAAALLKLASDAGLPYVVGLLGSHNPDIAIQAALALGESRQSAALAPLKHCWAQQTDPSVKDILLTCIGLLRQPEGTKFLLSLIAPRDVAAAAGAIRALAAQRSSPEVRRDVEAAVHAAGDSQLTGLFKTEFP